MATANVAVTVYENGAGYSHRDWNISAATADIAAPVAQSSVIRISTVSIIITILVTVVVVIITMTTATTTIIIAGWS